MTSEDSFDLERFVTAQAPVFERVLAELRAGRKRSHWMWFVFPQLRGLGQSETSRFYGIASIEEAHLSCASATGTKARSLRRIVLESEGPSLHAIFGSPGDMKFRSCMTLFLLGRTTRPIPSGKRPRVATIGNVLRHEYECIAYDVIWWIVTDDLQPLADACREKRRVCCGSGHGRLPGLTAKELLWRGRASAKLQCLDHGSGR